MEPILLCSIKRWQQMHCHAAPASFTFKQAVSATWSERSFYLEKLHLSLSLSPPTLYNIPVTDEHVSREEERESTRLKTSFFFLLLLLSAFFKNSNPTWIHHSAHGRAAQAGYATSLQKHYLVTGHRDPDIKEAISPIMHRGWGRGMEGRAEPWF